MAKGKGFESIAGFIKATTWGTAVAVSTGDAIRILNESISGGPEYLPDESINGTAFRDVGDTGNELFEGSIECYLRYRGLDLLIAMAFGTTAGAPTNASVASAAYQQYFRPSDNLEGLFGTYCNDRTSSNDIVEFDSAKVNAVTISATAGERVMASFDLVCRDFSNDSAINTDSSTWTDPDSADNREFVIFEDATVYMEAEDQTLAVGDLVYPSEFSITLNNNLVGDVTTANAPNIDEPVRDGYADVSGSITFPVWGDGSGADAAAGEKWEDAFFAKTNYALEINFTGSTIVSSYNNEFNIFLPNVEFTSNDANIGGPGKIGHTLNFVATTPQNVVDFVNDRETTFLYPIWVEIQNREDGDVLA